MRTGVVSQGHDQQPPFCAKWSEFHSLYGDLLCYVSCCCWCSLYKVGDTSHVGPCKLELMPYTSAVFPLPLFVPHFALQGTTILNWHIERTTSFSSTPCLTRGMMAAPPLGGAI